MLAWELADWAQVKEKFKFLQPVNYLSVYYNSAVQGSWALIWKQVCFIAVTNSLPYDIFMLVHNIQFIRMGGWIHFFSTFIWSRFRIVFSLVAVVPVGFPIMNFVNC